MNVMWSYKSCTVLHQNKSRHSPRFKEVAAYVGRAGVDFCGASVRLSKYYLEETHEMTIVQQ
jgi:hypothetical protein